ncbi:MAG: hypothetical protein QW261_11205 [Candidatus Jordarchaeaceae archaeon]
MELSEFTMFEKAPYEKVDDNVQVDIMIKGMKDQEKMYGPVFTAKIIKNSLEFLAQKTGEPQPQNIKDLDQLENYLVSEALKYDKSICVLSYAQIKTENELQGQTGAGTFLQAIGVTKKMVDVSTVKERNIDVEKSLHMFRNTIVGLKVAPVEMGYKKNGNGSVDILFVDCPTKDACQKAFDEGLLKRPDGRLRCSSGAVACRFLKLLTNFDWDYERVEAYKPHCIFNCYMI